MVRSCCVSGLGTVLIRDLLGSRLGPSLQFCALVRSRLAPSVFRQMHVIPGLGRFSPPFTFCFGERAFKMPQ